MIVAISSKALKYLEGTELGKLIASGKKGEGDTYEVTVDETIDAKLQDAKGERSGKHSALADRIIAKVTEARTAETETAAPVVR